jgi:hypothetical protein
MKPKRGQIVEFTLQNHPDVKPGSVVRGYVTDAWDGIGLPFNPVVHVPGIGRIELLRAWWGVSVREVPCLFGLDTVPAAYRGDL